MIFILWRTKSLNFWSESTQRKGLEPHKKMTKWQNRKKKKKKKWRDNRRLSYHHFFWANFYKLKPLEHNYLCNAVNKSIDQMRLNKLILRFLCWFSFVKYCPKSMVRKLTMLCNTIILLGKNYFLNYYYHTEVSFPK